METNKIYQGNTLELLKQIPSNFVNTIITSPPYYGLRSYPNSETIWNARDGCQHEWGEEIIVNKITPGDRPSANSMIAGKRPNEGVNRAEGRSCFCSKCHAWRGMLGLEPNFNLYLNHLIEITAELKRVLSPHGCMFWNHGDTYNTKRGSGKIYENISNTEANYEEVSDFRKTVLGTQPVPIKSLMQIPERFAIRLTDEQGWVLRNTGIWSKGNTMPSSATDRFTNSYEFFYFFTKSPKYYFIKQRETRNYPNAKVKEMCKEIISNAKMLGHKKLTTLYEGKQSLDTSTQSNGLQEFVVAVRTAGEQLMAEHFEMTKEERMFIMDFIHEGIGSIEGRGMRDVFNVNTESSSFEHFATYPESLIEPFIRGGCPESVCSKCGKPKEPVFSDEGSIKIDNGNRSIADENNLSKTSVFRTGEIKVHNLINYSPTCSCNAEFLPGIVLDPFMGSGTTAEVALKLKRRFIGLEINPTYVEIANKRLAPYLNQMKL